MISNHAQFIDAIREKNLIRVVFYSIPDAGTVDHECIPLDYGPEPGVAGASNSYWIWDRTDKSAPNPLGLQAGQIVSVQVLGRNFYPEKLPLGARPWSVVRNWENKPMTSVKT